MKTTIDLPDGLAHQAKTIARKHHLTLREMITSGLRTEIDRLANEHKKPPFQMCTFAGNGMKPGVSEKDLTRLAYEEV